MDKDKLNIRNQNKIWTNKKLIIKTYIIRERRI